MVDTDTLFKEALLLDPKERAELIDKLLSSFDNLDTQVDALWAQEAEDRIKAYEQGKMRAVSLEDVLRKYK
ncbi:MAG: addiction module protein [Spirochaetota bacterium]